MIQELIAVVHATTRAYRKGAVVREEDHGGLKVVHVDGYPSTPSRGILVDVHFINVGFTEAVATLTRERFYEMIDASADGVFNRTDHARLAEGLSYIELGAWLGDQETALRFLALGEHLGAWTVITPKLMGLEGDDADALAGIGMVMNGGMIPGVVAP